MRISLPQKQFLVSLIAALLIFLFVYTGISKLMNIEGFRRTITWSPLLSKNSRLLSWSIPFLELGISGLLFIPYFRLYGFLLSTVILASFTLYIVYMLMFIPELPCSCGGVIQQMNWTQHLIFNLFFLGLSIYGWIVTKKEYKDFIAINRTSQTPV